MSAQTVAGTQIGISAVLPVTFDAAGYGALAYAKIGEITDGGSHGRTYQVVNHNPIDTRGTQKFKGSFNEGQKTIQLACDPEDPGQAVVKVALNDDADYAFCVTYQDGSKDYFLAKVTSWSKSTTSVDSMYSASVGLELTTAKDGTGIVEVNAVSVALTYTADANGTLVGAASQTISLGGTGTPVAAVAAAGYVFSKWSDNKTANPRIDTHVTGNVTVQAQFAPE